MMVISLTLFPALVDYLSWLQLWCTCCT